MTLAICPGHCPSLNTLRPRQDGRLFPDEIFKSIFFNENVQILIKISLTFVPKAPINNIPALVRKMAWRRPGDKPLSEPMMVSLLAHICVTRPQWVKTLRPKQNALHFADDIWNEFSSMKKVCILIEISLKLLWRVQLAMSQYWFR